MPNDTKKAGLSTLRRALLSVDGGPVATAPEKTGLPALEGRGLGEGGDEPGPEHVVYADPYHTIYKLGVRVRCVDKEYRVIESGSRAGVLPVKGDAILLVRQYRLLIDGLSWEIPGGKVEAGETPRQAAIRECCEETGVQCRDLQPLAGYHPGLDTFCNPTYLYSSNDISESATAMTPQGETVAMAWFPLAEALDMILSLQIVDAFTMIGVMSYKIRSDLKGRDVAAIGEPEIPGRRAKQ